METLNFKEQPRIGNRTDAINLLDWLLSPDCPKNHREIEAVILAIRDAIKRGIV